MFPIRILAVAAVVLAGGAGASGQEGCDTLGGCGPSPLFGTGALFAPNKHHARYPDANHPLCATKNYPISDWKYISKYCGPTLNPGSCYGHYQTKWRRWEDICPQGSLAYAPSGPPTFSGAVSTYTGGAPPAGSSPHPQPETIPAPLPLPAPTPLPMPMPKDKEPAPKLESLAPLPNPVLSVPVSTVDAAPRTLKELAPSIVPPLRDFPERGRN